VRRSWPKVKVTDSRAAVDFAASMSEFTNVHFSEAERIRVALDNESMMRYSKSDFPPKP